MSAKVRKTWICVISVLIVLTLCFIFGNSLKNGEDSDDQSSAVADFLKPIFDPYNKISDEQFGHFIRKLAHFSEFCLLCFECVALFYVIFEKINAISIVSPLGFSLLCADVDEFIQSFTQGRGSSVKDVMIDFSGAITGAMICLLIIILIEHIKKRRKLIK